MHHIYPTEAIIFSSKARGESGKILAAFCKDYGLIKIEAQSVRQEKSKLRQSIQDYSLVQLSFVRGKTGNRLVNALAIENFYYNLREESSKKFLAKFMKLLERMITDEDYDPEVYSAVVELCQTLAEIEDQPDLLEALELLGVYKVLGLLGYVAKEGILEFIFENKIDLGNLHKMRALETKKKREIVNLINRGINESHL